MSAKFPPRERFNWGYWDGRADQERGRFPLWCKSYNSHKHPSDKVYGRGYWAGRYDTSGANSSDEAWRGRAEA